MITKITWDYNWNVIEKEEFSYDGPIALCCGASSQQKQIEAEQASYYKTLQDQAVKEFGNASKVFNDLYSAMSPIVAAGPNQEGFSAEELSDLNNTAITSTSQSFKNAAQSVRQSEAARGGSNFVPSGANIQTDLTVADSAASQLSTNLTGIKEADYATGRQNYFTAAGDLAGATGTFNAATGAAGAANQGGSAAASTANEITQANNSWVQAVTGALGGIAGGMVTGGMSNIGKGVGFFGGNAPAPGH